MKNLSLPEQFFAKLRGTWLTIHDDRAEAGPLLKETLKLHKELEVEAQKMGNEWRKYFESNKWLQKFIEDGKEL